MSFVCVMQCNILFFYDDDTKNVPIARHKEKEILNLYEPQRVISSLGIWKILWYIQNILDHNNLAFKFQVLYIKANAYNRNIVILRRVLKVKFIRNITDCILKKVTNPRISKCLDNALAVLSISLLFKESFLLFYR